VNDFHSDCKRQLLTAADALFGPPSPDPIPRTRSRRRLPVLASSAIAVLLLAAAAFAAGRIIGIGAPVEPGGGPEPPSRAAGVGIPVAGSYSNGRPRSAIRVALSVPDPAGGPPWGMRIVTTTRGLLCVQVGRLLDGRLGVLGQDGQFENDGLFHELPPGALDQSTCSQPGVLALYTASALPDAGMLPGDFLSCARRVSGPRHCRAGAERTVAFGVLGPHAVSVSYKADNRLHTTATRGGHGAYLIVLSQPPRPTRPDGLLAAHFLSPQRLPVTTAGGFLPSTIVFRFGARHCQAGPEHQSGGPPRCTAAAASALARLAPTASTVRPSIALKAHKTTGGYALDLAFTAPAAVQSASTAYGVEYTAPSGSDCRGSGGGGLPIERDIRRGQRVHVTLLVSPRRGCRGAIRGRIVFGRQAGALTGPIYDERTIARFSFEAR
jgi:hypothetical protein